MFNKTYIMDEINYSQVFNTNAINEINACLF